MAFRDPERLRCPRCTEAALSPRRALHVEHAGCTACGGLWFERAAFAELARELDVPDDRPLGERVVSALASPPCPHCAAALARYQVAESLFVDVCADHGIWFDTDEL